MADGSDDLLGFVASMGGERALRVEENLGEGYVRLRVAEAERRQAKHDVRCVEDVVIEMLRNARDAGARHIYVATTREGDLRSLVMIDDGSGIPEDMQDRIFEARVTSKLESVHMDRWGVHGRGMALFSVRENAVSAAVASSGVGLGSSIKVVTDATQLSERRDQSTWPSVGVDEDGVQSCVRGPHNIIRTCCDFALEERSTCEVYLGSPAEIAATARMRAASSVDGADLLFIDSLSELPRARAPQGRRRCERASRRLPRPWARDVRAHGAPHRGRADQAPEERPLPTHPQGRARRAPRGRPKSRPARPQDLQGRRRGVLAHHGAGVLVRCQALLPLAFRRAQGEGFPP